MFYRAGTNSFVTRKNMPRTQSLLDDGVRIEVRPTFRSHHTVNLGMRQSKGSSLIPDSGNQAAIGMT